MPRLVHLTTTDMSLDWLLAPQLRAFADAGYDVVGMSAPGPHVEHLASMGIRHVPVPAFTRSANPLQDLRAFGQLVRLLRKERPDVLHTHNPKPGIIGRIAGRVARVPRIVNTQHGLYAQPEDPWQRRWPVYAVERIAAGFGHVELVQNPEDVHTLVDRLRVPARRVRLLGNGIDLDRFDPDALDVADADARNRLRAEWGFGPDDVVVGTVGRLVAEKGIVELLDAAGRLHDSTSSNDDNDNDNDDDDNNDNDNDDDDNDDDDNDDDSNDNTAGRARFVIVGPGDPDKSDALPDRLFDDAAALGVVLAGQRTDMPECYRAMDVFVTASWREGFPRSAMEAAAMGLPTVATDIRGNRQVVDHDVTGLLVTPRDADAIARAIGALVNDQERRTRFGEAARRRAIEQFDQRTVIERTLAAYRR